jgi:aryl-alcohol dehydrogenase-like predicted oxidoreductase
LRRLRTDYIDLYYLHRVDPQVPVEESVGALADLVAAGVVRAIGICTDDVKVLDRAVAVHPLAAVQIECSVFTREPLADVLPWCARNDSVFVPFSPLGRGLLAGRFRSTDSLDEGDMRRRHPRFQPKTLPANVALVEALEAIAFRAGATPAQVALAWLLAQDSHVVPIPGTKRLERLAENAAAAELRLTADDLAAVDALPPPVGSHRFAPDSFF